MSSSMKAIARAAMRFVELGQAIFLDDATTVHEMTAFLPAKVPLTVITNNLAVIVELSGQPGIELIGVEAELYASFSNAIRGEDRTIGGATLAEGIAVKTVGQMTLPIVAALILALFLRGMPAVSLPRGWQCVAGADR